LNDEGCEQLNRLIKLTVVPGLKYQQRRAKMLVFWVAALTAVSAVSLGVAVATVMMIYGR
tara:strand:- start:65 stop:244 length:180 start_codon:yes stop_codon:yes gene_type:complete